jgi:hypothetical protein
MLADIVNGVEKNFFKAARGKETALGWEAHHKVAGGERYDKQLRNLVSRMSQKDKILWWLNV